MPGCIVSATTASFRSVEKRRRRATPVITSTFENVSDIGVCLGLYLGPPAKAGVRSKRGAVQPCQGRAPYGPQLSEGARRRSDQCRARRRRLQLRPPPALAGKAFARPLPGARRNIAECSLGLKTGDQLFFTGDL